MGKIVEKRKKKKKGRPSLLDLQKRTLKEQQHQQKHQFPNRKLPISNNSTLRPSPNYNSATPPSSLRRSSRRNPTPSSPDIESQQDDDDEEEDEDDDDAAQLNGKRREKKLKLVLKLPSNQKLDPDSASLYSNASDSNGYDDNASVSRRPKRKINAIDGGSGFGASVKREKSVSGANPTNNTQDWGPSTPLPDKKLLLFILDRLQKKDTHGVFSEPVDPDELPDYHEVIAHPMDFGTIRKKITSGAYATLEQFEKDVYLISSNAMQYNAPDTIYFRQARAIQELAKKSFENLRQDSDDNGPEPEPEPKPEPDPEPKVVRRGRPPTKNLKKPPGRPSLAQAHSDFSFNANLISGGESTLWSNNDLRKGPIASGNGFRMDAHWSAENKFEKNIEGAGSIFKGSPFKYGKKQYVADENRRNTYKQFSSSGREPSVLATFDAERKQLVAVGLLSEHGYARSLARFAANIGPAAWKIASTRIERSLPPGVKYGHGWVGENDIPPQRPMFLSSASHPLSLPENSCDVATTTTPSIAANNSIENSISVPTTRSPTSTSSPTLGANKSSTHLENAEVVEGLLNPHSGSNMSRPPFQTGMNGFHLPGQMGKLVEAARSAGFNFQSNNRTNSTATLIQGSQSKDAATTTLPNSENELCWEGTSSQPRPESVAPDLNVIFQSPGSPSSSRVESGQPDLVLQL